jgi:hypothetical protein
MYGTIRNRPTNKFNGLPDCIQESRNSRPTACRFCRPIGYFTPSLKGDCHPIFRDGALQCCSIVLNLIWEVEKPVLYTIHLKEYSFENGRPHCGVWTITPEQTGPDWILTNLIYHSSRLFFHPSFRIFSSNLGIKFTQ